ncbi:YdcF family protein [Hoyosella sp. YIM 151337]|uniref:YdcF family protein n=1 Tax=Hoyosella sp. YIM 151337 TaxID=2992742 RepID=UPI002236A511|nr:YdcF family protein [Hoyosella sp. YIM 151337]MCW4353056.1 YdcF family protein [Hoyosella sp. YIM 151337]
MTHVSRVAAIGTIALSTVAYSALTVLTAPAALAVPATNPVVVADVSAADAANLYNRAQAKFTARDAAGGLADLRAMLAITPDDVDALALQAIWSEQLDDAATRDGALSALERVDSAAAQMARNVIDGVNAAAQIVPSTQPVAAPSAPTAIVMLGYGLNDDGSMAPELVNRVAAGLAQAQATPDLPLFVSGGVPKRGITEAAAMKEWLLAQGVPASRITTEERSTSTVSNAQFTTELLQQLGISEVVLVTSPSHVRRAAAAFAATGTRVAGTVTTDTDIASYLTPYTREQQAGIRVEATRAARIPVTKAGSPASPQPSPGVLPGWDLTGLPDVLEVVGELLDLLLESGGSLER